MTGDAMVLIQPSGAPAGRVKRSLVKAARLSWWIAAFAATAQAQTQSDLNSILRPEVKVLASAPNPRLEISFTNLGTKEITAFEFSEVDVYASGEQVSRRMAGGADLVGYVAGATALGVPHEAIQRLQPGQTYSQKVSVPGRADSSPLTRSDVTVTSVIFADRTGLGNWQEINSFLASRSQVGEWIAAALQDVRACLTGNDPGGQVGALIARAEADPGHPGNPIALGIFRSISIELSKGEHGQVQKLLASWEARGQASRQHSALRERELPR